MTARADEEPMFVWGYEAAIGERLQTELQEGHDADVLQR